MIMVSFPFLSVPLCISERSIEVLCIENQKLFREVYYAFVSDTLEESNIVFSRNFEPFNKKEKLFVIDEYFSLSYSNAIMKKIYEQMEAFCNIELQRETLQLKSHIVKYLERLANDFDYDFDFDYAFSMTELFKTVNLKPVSDGTDKLNMLLDYILIIEKYVSPECFVLFNLHLYFTEDEIAGFYKDIISKHIKILVVENIKTFVSNKDEKIIIYDKDFCEIVDI